MNKIVSPEDVKRVLRTISKYHYEEYKKQCDNPLPYKEFEKLVFGLFQFESGQA